ncbi:MAG: hypothetical protein IV111_00120, partial [Pseudomonas sp.]|nr:hypothetical protein [Pseudomonas sp.]
MAYRYQIKLIRQNSCQQTTIKVMRMTVSTLLICDDSSMARKQLLRALPGDWPVAIVQVANGMEAMAVLRQGQTD